MRIGVLALQGDFSKHVNALASLGIIAKEVRKPEDLKDCEGLILPGGESTVILRQIDFIQLRESILSFAKKKPLFGTCAGLIAMSRKVEAFPLKSLNLLDIEVERNAFGRQVESFQALITLELTPGHSIPFPAFFIRAPRIKRWGEEVEVLASFENEPILVKQGRHLGATFHPELISDLAIHEYFISLVRQSLP